MIRSMTAYGEARADTDQVAVTARVRSVNHRFLDVRIKLPAELSVLEGPLRRRIQSAAKRGRVEARLDVELLELPEGAATLNRPLAQALVQAAHVLEREMGVAGTLDVATVLAQPGVVRVDLGSLPDRESLSGVLDSALEAALEAWNQEREREGRILADDLRRRVRSMQGVVENLNPRAATVPARLKERLEARVRELLGGEGVVEPGRLEQEVAFLAERADVSEELVRLEAHLKRLDAVLRHGGEDSPGKAMEFLLQEIHREINTLGSKAAELEVTEAVLALKGEAERIREQVQNVE